MGNRWPGQELPAGNAIEILEFRPHVGSHVLRLGQVARFEVDCSGAL